MQTLERVREIVAEELNVKPDLVKDDASLKDDLDADSLAMVNIIMLLEEEFGIDIPDEEADKIRTIAEAAKFVDQQLVA